MTSKTGSNSSSKTDKMKVQVLTVMAHVCWEIWKSRNDKAFEDKVTSTYYSATAEAENYLFIDTMLPSRGLDRKGQLNMPIQMHFWTKWFSMGMLKNFLIIPYHL